MDPARREALRILAELLEAGLHEAHLVGLVVDREARAVAEALGLAAQDPAARGVEGEDPDRPRHAAERPLEPLAHLGRGLVRERDREDLVRLHAVRTDQVRDAMGEDAGLSRACAGDDEQRPVDVEHGLPLGRIEPLEELVMGRDGHGVDASRGPRSRIGQVRLAWRDDLAGNDRRRARDCGPRHGGLAAPAQLGARGGAPHAHGSGRRPAERSGRSSEAVRSSGTPSRRSTGSPPSPAAPNATSVCIRSTAARASARLSGTW